MEKQSITPITVDRIVTIGVDIQNDFITGSLAVADAESTIEPMNHLLDYTRAQDGTVALTRDWHPETTAHFDTWPVHCVEETEGADFHPNLSRHSEDIIISKGTSQIDDGYSGFEGTAEDGATLEALIRPRTLRERVGVQMGGLATDFCLKATALDGLRIYKNTPNVYIAVATDTARGVDLTPGDSVRAIEEMKESGAIMTDTTALLAGEIFTVERTN